MSEVSEDFSDKAEVVFKEKFTTWQETLGLQDTWGISGGRVQIA